MGSKKAKKAKGNGHAAKRRRHSKKMSTAIDLITGMTAIEFRHVMEAVGARREVIARGFGVSAEVAS